MMRHFYFVLALLLSCFKTADAMPSRIWWPVWTISSSEELSGGIEYSKNEYTPSFPLSYLFDNDAKTAWVYSAKSREFFSPFRSRYGVHLKPTKPVTIDGLRIMNGQNASRARFLSNKRVTKIRVMMEVGKQKIVRHFNLSETMGFHNLTLPRRKINSLMVEFVGLKNGKGDNDLCISELQLTNRGQKFDMQMPRAVMFYDGMEGDSGAMYLLRGNVMLDAIGLDDGSSDEWSADGRYVAGASLGGGDKSQAYLWIADTWHGKIVRKIYNAPNDYSWKCNQLQLSNDVNEKPVPLKLLSPPLFK